MSYEVAFYQPLEDPDDEEAGEHFFLASTGGWGAFIHWVTALPEEDYPSLVRFCKEGMVKDTEALREQLKQAFKAHRPDSQFVRSVARQLFWAIRWGDPEEVAAVEV
ncbi:MAG TPA: hypothetical protein VF590_27935 [Isosphaeraceae bacterium]|jgi:hypothetical protein